MDDSLPYPAPGKHAYEHLIQGVLEKEFSVLDGFIPQILRADLLTQLKALYGEGEMQAAGIGKQEAHRKDESVRSDLIHWIGADTQWPAEQQFLAIVADFMAYLNRTCYTSLTNSEFHYALYREGCFYKKHLDQFVFDSGRQFSMIVYLNDTWAPEDGGELMLYFPEETVKVLPIGGRAVFFKSDVVPHEVLAANRSRYSLTGWLKTKTV